MKNIDTKRNSVTKIVTILVFLISAILSLRESMAADVQVEPSKKPHTEVGPAPSALLLANTKLFAIWAQQSSRKILPASAQFTDGSGMQPAPLELTGAKGEYVSFQLVFVPKEDVENVALIFSDIENTGSNEVIAHDNISLYRVGDVHVKALSDNLTPDPLIPGDSVTAKAGELATIFVKIKIPSSASAGAYTGGFAIKGLASRKFSFDLRVWNFSIPANSNLRTAFGFDSRNMPETNRNQYVNAYLDNMAQHRIAATEPALPEIAIKDDRLKLDTSGGYDDVMEYAIGKLGMNTISMPAVLFGVRGETKSFLGAPPLTGQWKDLMSKYLQLIIPYLRNKGWYDKVVYFIWDEPDKSSKQSPKQSKEIFDTINKIADYIHGFDCNAKLYINASEEFLMLGELGRNISLVVPSSDLEAKPGSPRGPKPKRWLSLDGLSEEWMRSDLINPRIVPWVAWAYGMEGLALKSVNAWNNQTPAPASKFRSDLLYPDKTGLPLNSLRWEALGDGMEDYEYLSILEIRIAAVTNESNPPAAKQTQEVENAKNLLEEIKQAIFKRKEAPVSLTLLSSYRERLGQAIENVYNISFSPTDEKCAR